MQEAKWCDLEYIPRFDEYIKNGNVSSTYLQILAAAYQGMEIAHANVFEWLHGQPKPLAAICMIGRVLNDIATFKVFLIFNLKSIGQSFERLSLRLSPLKRDSLSKRPSLTRIRVKVYSFIKREMGARFEPKNFFKTRN